MMYFTQYDIEYIILFTVLGILFVGSLHRKDFLTIGGGQGTILRGLADVFSLKRYCLYFYIDGTLGLYASLAKFTTGNNKDSMDIYW